VDTELQHLISGQYNLITLLLVHIGLTWFRFCLEVTSVRLYCFVWYHSGNVVIYRDFSKATLFSFCKITVNRRDSGIFTVIANIGQHCQASLGEMVFSPTSLGPLECRQEN
jgi:hypothetical protein